MPANASMSEKSSTNSRLRNDQSMTRLIRAWSLCIALFWFCIVHFCFHVFALLHAFTRLHALTWLHAFMGLHAFNGGTHGCSRIKQELAVDRHFCTWLDAVGDRYPFAVFDSRFNVNRKEMPVPSGQDHHVSLPGTQHCRAWNYQCLVGLSMDGHVNKAAGMQTQFGIVYRHSCADLVVFGDGIEEVEFGFDGLSIGTGYGYVIPAIYLSALVGIQRDRNPYSVS